MNYLRSIAIFFVFFTITIISAQKNYWQQSVDYKMEVVLLDSVRQLACKSIITYKNNSPDTLHNIYMHLYPNAFQIGSVKHREYMNNYGRDSRAKYFKNDLVGYESKIDIRNFTIAKNGDIILLNYKVDDTILHAKLNKPLLPNEDVRIDMDWNHHVGGMVERAGYFEGQYNMAQWYPKLAAYDEEGWHAQPFHAEGEFYGEFGDFDISFELPERFIMGASGVVISGDPGWQSVRVDTSSDFSEWLEAFEKKYEEPIESSVRKVRFLAENVHDFAWVASPNFLYEYDNWGGIDIHVLYNKVNASDWNRVVRQRSVRAMKWLTNKFGEYPYPQVTNTDRLKSGGMEYPMLIMDGSDSESLILHEIGHIWFYGVLANNELDEAWLDEGFTSAQTRDYMIDRYGSKGFDWKSDDWTDPYQRKYWSYTNRLHSDQWYSIRYITSVHDEPVSRESYQYKSGSSYRQNVYTKPSLMLNELKYVLGDSLYYLSIQEYYNNWKLKHVNESRFITSVENATGKELNWFFDAWLHDTRVMDYEINSWRKNKNDDGSYSIDLNVKSLGNRYMPLLIETDLSNGDIHRQWWRNHLWRVKDTLRYVVPSKPLRVTLDPDVQTMDVDFRNNSTSMNRKFVFDWPGMRYNPRDTMVYRWLPSLYYNNIDSYAPGIRIDQAYGHWEKTRLWFNYALKKDTLSNQNEIYWSYFRVYKPVHFFRNSNFKLWGFNQPGLQEFGAEVESRISNTYQKKPYFTYKAGFYAQPSVDTLRTDLFDPGKLAVLYLKYEIDHKLIDVDSEFSSSVDPYSDWSFNRFTLVTSMSKNKSFSNNNIMRKLGGFGSGGYRTRLFMGKIWTNKNGVPNQEGYNVEGNSSVDMFKKSYLRNDDSFFGVSQFNQNYHMPGEGNIRGFVNQSEKGSDAVISLSSELFMINKQISLGGYLDNNDISCELALFSDGGIFYNQSITRRMADAGVGIRIGGNIYNKPLYLRLDFPFFLLKNNKFINNDNQWVVSFQKGI
tara:strand:- start:10780 stop:13785 length:3006 start_codon:yes stop_codon:yes gene_type:complete